MRLVVPCLAVALMFSGWAARGQSADNTTADLDVRDAYGNPLRAPETEVVETPSGKRTYERTRNLNGNTVRLDGVTEKVLRKDAHTVVIERNVQLYDPNGNPTQKVRQLITETKADDGTVNSSTETWRSDVNGNMAFTEKKDIVERKVGPSTLESQTTVYGPNVNGSVDLLQKNDAIRESSGKGTWRQTEIIERAGQNGLYESNKIVTEHVENGNRTSDNIAEYEIGSTGALDLHQQTTKTTVTSANGSSVTETDYYNRHAPGYAYESGNPNLALRAREVTEHRVGDQGAVDTLSVQQPSISDPTQLGPPKVVSQTVCTGACK